MNDSENRDRPPPEQSQSSSADRRVPRTDPNKEARDIDKRPHFDSGKFQPEYHPADSFVKSDLGRQVSAFVTHLEELRVRLFRAILSIVAGMIVCLIFSERIVNFIIATAGKAGEVKLTLLTPAEGVMVYLKVGLVAGIFVASPVWFTQLWGFISPGLYRKEKRVIVPVIAASVGAFLVGAAFGYLLLPYTAAYFMSFAGGNVEALWSLSSYVYLALQFTLSFGIIFELPLIIYAAAALGIVTPAMLRKYRRHAVIGILILAAFITPGPDIFSQLVVAVPLLILFEAGILMAVIAATRRKTASPNPAEGV